MEEGEGALEAAEEGGILLRFQGNNKKYPFPPPLSPFFFTALHFVYLYLINELVLNF